MEKYSLNKYDFKKFLLAELADAKQVDLIFWKKTIPMPVDLIYNIFEKRGELLKKYIDHIGSAFIYHFVWNKNRQSWMTALDSQPTKENLNKKDELRSVIAHSKTNSKAQLMLKEIADLLLLYDYEVTDTRLVDALCHEGRKYKRLYLPAAIKDVIAKYDGTLLCSIAQSNGDMFSNVVADELNIYRMGFADAFSGIFNKLIDYVLGFSNIGRKSYTSASDIRLVVDNKTTEEAERNFYGTVVDGSVWEPRYVNSTNSFVLNENHPYCDYVIRKGKPAEQVLIEFAQYLSEIENETIRDSDRNTIEIMRQELSRRLRIKAEKGHTAFGKDSTF